MTMPLANAGSAQCPRRGACSAAAAAERRFGSAAEWIERRGSAVLHLVGRELVRVENVAVPGAGRAGLCPEVLRVDPFDPSHPAAGRPLAEQVWARDTGGGVSVRGRLLLDAGGAVFVEEPGAGTGRRGDRRPGGRKKPRNFEADVCGCAAVRAKAMASEAYAWLLHAALADSAWRHEDGSAFRVAARDALRLVAQAVGRGDFTDWLWSAPAGVLDGEVLDDLAALGWRRVGSC